MKKVFVYGTLKRGYSNYSYFLKDSKFINEAVTTKLYEMVNLGSFPAIIPNNKGKKVSGEVFLVDDWTLSRLDILEGEGQFYTRITENFIIGDKQFSGFVYILDYYPRHYNYNNIITNNNILTYERI
jgi:gamma-glutamylcyclotransferase (GGCT)/AIG2-like uncharacterized protein YtfP